MKSIFSLILLECFPMVTFAGTPDQDPVVMLARTDLASGTTPNKTNLMLGSKWDCLVIDAGKNSFNQFHNVISFDSFDGLVNPTFWAIDGNSKASVDQQLIGAMAFTQKGLVGHASHGLAQNFLFRLHPNGTDLVTEISIPRSVDFGNKDSYTTSAIYDQNALAIFYSICPKANILK